MLLPSAGSHSSLNLKVIECPGLLGSCAFTKHDLSASITHNPSRARYCCYSPLRASLPVHSFCSSAFAFAAQHPALESDLTIPPISPRCYISKDHAFHSILAQSRALEQDLPETVVYFSYGSYGSVNLPYLRHITFLRAEHPPYRLRRRAGFSCACNANCWCEGESKGPRD